MKASQFLRAFRTHPASVGESYFGHMAFALRFSGRLMMAGAAALVHAVIPPLCETTASRITLALADDLVAHRRGAAQDRARLRVRSN
ncbi:MAG: DUF6356 family protein [Paracoccaceae bacterium]